MKDTIPKSNFKTYLLCIEKVYLTIIKIMKFQQFIENKNYYLLFYIIYKIYPSLFKIKLLKDYVNLEFE